MINYVKLLEPQMLLPFRLYRRIRPQAPNCSGQRGKIYTLTHCSDEKRYTNQRPGSTTATTKRPALRAYQLRLLRRKSESQNQARMRLCATNLNIINHTHPLFDGIIRFIEASSAQSFIRLDSRSPPSNLAIQLHRQQCCEVWYSRADICVKQNTGTCYRHYRLDNNTSSNTSTGWYINTINTQA